MSLFRSRSLFAAIKCDMCPKIVANMVYGLCERCVIIWTNKRSLENITITIEHVKAVLVSMVHNNAHYEHMDDTFRRVIEDNHRGRKFKLDLFQKIREKFQNEVLIQEKGSYYFIRYETEEDYFEIDIPKLDINDLTVETRLPYHNVL